MRDLEANVLTGAEETKLQYDYITDVLPRHTSKARFRVGNGAFVPNSLKSVCAFVY